MRVGLVVFDDVDYGLDLANALDEAGVEVSLYLSLKHVALYLGSPDRPSERLFEVGLLPPACKVRTFRLPRMRDLGSIEVVRRIARAVRTDGVDVVHMLVGPGDLWMAVLSLLLRDAPVASTMIIPKPNVGEALPALVTMAIYRLLARGSDVVIVNGAAQVAEIRKTYGIPARRAAYVPLGPRTTAAKWAAGNGVEEPGTVLFFGAARPHKGLQYLVQAQPLITRCVPQARILVASRGEELKRCQRMMQDPSKFEIHEGFVPGDVVADYFQRACVVALPYLSASTSGILMTAYVFGKPVVATRVGCLPEYVEDGVTGLLVPPADVEKLAHAIIRILSDSVHRHQMGWNAQRRADEKRKIATQETLRAYERAIAIHDGA
jgi:glycosyltransferase involved in cell wall biosynthesis